MKFGGPKQWTTHRTMIMLTGLSQLLSSYAYVNEQLAKSQSVDVVYLDFSLTLFVIMSSSVSYGDWV